MFECPNCEGAIMDCISDEGAMECPRCGYKEDQYGKKIPYT